MTGSGAASTGHSSTVQLLLLVEGRSLRLSHIGPTQAMLKEPVELPETDAEVFMSIDGHVHTWPVRLINGAVPYEVEVANRLATAF